VANDVATGKHHGFTSGTDDLLRQPPYLATHLELFPENYYLGHRTLTIVAIDNASLTTTRERQGVQESRCKLQGAEAHCTHFSFSAVLLFDCTY